MAKFKFQGNEYKYFTASYNDTRHNERAVELGITLGLLDKYKGSRILEIGDVLSNYIAIPHDVVDKYEVRKGVINQDIVDYNPKDLYDLIISISTFEHIGWDSKEGKEPDKILKAIEHARWMLKEAGLMMITMPLGYNSDLEDLLKEKKLPFDKLFCMKRDDYNGWEEIDLDEALKLDYSREPCSIGLFKSPGGTEGSAVVMYVRFLVIGFIYGRPPRKDHKATFVASMGPEAS
jgi:hypothetical protein